MDVGAYQQIEKFEKLLKENNINIPCENLMGVRLMSEEYVILDDEIDEIIKDNQVNVVANLCDSKWKPNSTISDFSMNEKLYNRYLIINPNRTDRSYEKYVGIKWENIHGQNRKILKFELKKNARKIKKCWNVWNKYACVENVLYISVKNMDKTLEKELIKNHGFLDKVEDYFDSRYTDFYFKTKDN